MLSGAPWPRLQPWGYPTRPTPDLVIPMPRPSWSRRAMRTRRIDRDPDEAAPRVATDRARATRARSRDGARRASSRVSPSAAPHARAPAVRGECLDGPLDTVEHAPGLDAAQLASAGLVPPPPDRERRGQGEHHTQHGAIEGQPCERHVPLRYSSCALAPAPHPQLARTGGGRCYATARGSHRKCRRQNRLPAVLPGYSNRACRH